MNFKHRLLTTAATATAFIGMIAGPAQAFSFGASEIRFESDTWVEFDFFRSHGYYRSVFGIQELGGAKTNLIMEDKRADTATGANDWEGTPGNAVLNPAARFLFQAGKTYSMFLDLIRTSTGEQVALNESAKLFNTADMEYVLADTTYRDYNLSPNSRLATTAGSANINPFAGPVLIAFEDNGRDSAGRLHVDYNDFMVKARAIAPAAEASVPEPATLAGLALVGGAFAVSKRRRYNASQS